MPENLYLIIIIIIITSSDDIQPSTLLSNQSPSGLILEKSQALGNTLYDVQQRQHVFISLL